ncbi:hypothetical protein F5Y19DRAFT_439383 [Xylariaceae sp. FL1651]|nr:hypothetical protein F5Y19DRAFT_439383 [Xylariaceae sp. FL1651]
MSSSKQERTPLLGRLQRSMDASTQPPPVPHHDSWGDPVGLEPRGANDENLVIFRKALGINISAGNSDGAPTPTLEEGRKSATGIYKEVVRTLGTKRAQHVGLTATVYGAYFAQIVFGAALTALGSRAASHPKAIVVLGAFNTGLAGFLTLIRAAGQPGRLGEQEAEYRKLLDWLEETDALLANGIIGRDKTEVGALIQHAFRKYNAITSRTSQSDNQADMNLPSHLSVERGAGEGSSGEQRRNEDHGLVSSAVIVANPHE